MRFTMKRTLTLALALMLAMPTFAFADGAVEAQDAEEFSGLREEIPLHQRKELLTEIMYLAQRGKRGQELAFLKERMLPEEKRGMNVLLAAYAAGRAKNKLTGNRPNPKLRGYVR